MKYEAEIFISYAYIDDEALAEGRKGWVQLLDERLRKRLEQLLGQSVKIWRDTKLQGNAEFSEVLMQRVSKVALLVSILSPRYLKSEWCLRELDEFCQNAAPQGGLTVDVKSRVFKVVKTFTPRNTHPPQLRGLLGYEFYEYDEISGRCREFSPEIAPNRDAKYWEKLEDLACDIARQIERLHSAWDAPSIPREAENDRPVDSPTAAAIYVAETTSDSSEHRGNIKRQLQQHGHGVQSDKELPLRLFYSYSHKDEVYRDELETHLKLLQRQGLIEAWHDRRIEAGDEWKQEIDENLRHADIILLLVSADFIASDYCFEREMGHALGRHENRAARVIPVIVRDVDWKIGPFSKLQALPKDGKAVTLWDNRDAAWRNVSEGIRRVVERMCGRLVR